jgi:hypothetical protein
MTGAPGLYTENKPENCCAQRLIAPSLNSACPLVNTRWQGVRRGARGADNPDLFQVQRSAMLPPAHRGRS